MNCFLLGHQQKETKWIFKERRGNSKKSQFLRTVPTDKEVFCVVYDYAGKADISKGYWNPKRKFGVTKHFLEIIKQQLF